MIAYDREDAIALWAEYIGEDPKDYDPEDWAPLEPGEFRLTHEDEEDERADHKYFIQKYGRGYLASSEY